MISRLVANFWENIINMRNVLGEDSKEVHIILKCLEDYFRKLVLNKFWFYILFILK